VIRLALLEHARLNPLSRQPTAKELGRLTGLALSDRRLQQHVAAIRAEADIPFARRNSSDASEAASLTAMSATKIAEAS
jgi:hypothetical protein